MPDRIAIIGAGIGGLAAAMRLARAGCDVTVLERHDAPGGKMRTVPSVAGPVDAGPTVLTMRDVFEELFDAGGASLTDHVTLRPLDTLARHYWDDGATLDLFSDYRRSLDAVGVFAGARAARQFARFHRRAERLFAAFEGPMMRAEAPTLSGMVANVMMRPWLVPAMSPGRTLARSLRAQFTDPRLRQLFGRYATYVGGHPDAVPALLSLIWHAESRGVWSVEGGMHNLARAMEGVAKGAGARFQYGADVTRIEMQNGRVDAVHVGEERRSVDAVLFNGDPRALREGLLGQSAVASVPETGVAPRSLSAFVWSFAARPGGIAPHHHNVFFGHDAETEFEDLAMGVMPRDPTLYVCAQDRGHGATPAGAERFEIIMNGPPRSGTTPDPEEQALCRETTFSRLAKMGLTFSDRPEASALTTPEQFNHLFPATDGSLYGLSPHGMMAAFRRPRARTEIPGLYLCGGGAHPGAGIPMAAMSGGHAAAAIMRDRVSTSPSRRTAMGGGISTASPKTVHGPSR
ncbi:MAG: 1-hydroxycarotenoid 3,4-desaturase CrtD [Pseudomonadota bacterium]